MSITLLLTISLENATMKVPNMSQVNFTQNLRNAIFIYLLIPLFVSSFKRAEELAVAMDARCYRGGEGRTKLNPLKIGSNDIIVGLFLAGCAAGLVVMDLTLR